MNDALQQFRSALEAAGLTPPANLVADGRLHRCPSNGRSSDTAGWYILHMDGIPAGAYGDWRTGFSATWRADIDRPLTSAERSLHRERVKQMKEQREEALEDQQAKARQEAEAIWGCASPCTDHPYLTRKQVRAHKTRLYEGHLVIPVIRDRVLNSLQLISPNGEKRFLPGGRVAGCYFMIGAGSSAEAICLVEGFATGASIHEVTGHPVVVAFNAGNLKAVAEHIRERFPERPIIVCADDDPSEANPGLTKATEAALACGGLLAVPDFGSERPKGATDFNDLHQHAGPEALRRALRNAAPPEDPFIWEDPEPLTSSLDPGPYPLEVLPKIIRDAVEEVRDFVKAPIPLVAASALSAVSIAVQAHVDVKRADDLEGPTSLFLLTIAESGERKTSCDKHFMMEIRAFEDNKKEAAKPVISAYMAALEAWEATKAGIKDDIRKLAKQDGQTEARKADLREHEHSRPQAPRVPRIFFTDSTPEALAHSLATEWPAGGLVTPEAALVFGSHGMGKDSVMRNLGLLNTLWDGDPLHVDRRTGDSYKVQGARFTMALQVQPATMRAFHEQSGALARGVGFFARCLISEPVSTQGTRKFSDPPKGWPRRNRFNHRITTLLNLEPQMDGDHGLRPRVLSLSLAAKAIWVAFHDEVESELTPFGKFQEARDAASKAADNAARLAALFQAMHSLDDTSISAEYMEAGCTLARWYLYQALQFFGEMALPPELKAATKLEEWATRYCRSHGISKVATTLLMNRGPRVTRIKAKLFAAIGELEARHRVRLLDSPGEEKALQFHPALLQTNAAIPAIPAISPDEVHPSMELASPQSPQSPQSPTPGSTLQPTDPMLDKIDSQNAAPDSDGGFDNDELVHRLR